MLKLADKCAYIIKNMCGFHSGFKPIPMPRSSKRPQVSDSEDSEDTVSLTGNVSHRYFGADDQEISSLDAQWEDMYMSVGGFVEL